MARAARTSCARGSSARAISPGSGRRARPWRCMKRRSRRCIVGVLLTSVGCVSLDPSGIAVPNITGTYAATIALTVTNEFEVRPGSAPLSLQAGREVTHNPHGSAHAAGRGAGARHSVSAIGPRIGVAVLNWNGRDDSIACLESLIAADPGPDRTVVVDNGSTDD